MQKNRRKAPYIFAESFGTEPTSGVICVLPGPTSWTRKTYHPVQFPYAFDNKPHLFAAIFERFYTERKGYPTPRKVAKAILHPVLHPTLHLKPSVNTAYPGHWCRKCRIFFTNFFRGEDRNDSQSEYGNPKTPDFFEGNIRTFKAKHRNFPSKKSDVFDFRKGPAFRHSTRLQIRGANRGKHHQQKLFGFVLRYMPENGLQNAADCLFCFRDFEGFGGFPRPAEEHFQAFIAFRWAEIQTPLQSPIDIFRHENRNRKYLHTDLQFVSTAQNESV